MSSQAELFNKMSRALARADALVDHWAADRTPITRAEAAELFAIHLELNSWEQTEAQPHLRAVPTPEGNL